MQFVTLMLFALLLFDFETTSWPDNDLRLLLLRYDGIHLRKDVGSLRNVYSKCWLDSWCIARLRCLILNCIFLLTWKHALVVAAWSILEVQVLKARVLWYEDLEKSLNFAMPISATRFWNRWLLIYLYSFKTFIQIILYFG